MDEQHEFCIEDMQDYSAERLQEFYNKLRNDMGDCDDVITQLSDDIGRLIKERGEWMQRQKSIAKDVTKLAIELDKRTN